MAGRASACGKVILFGEHAVVYGRPAIAVPVGHVRAWAEVTPAPALPHILLRLADLGREVAVGAGEAAGEEPLARLTAMTLDALGAPARGLLITVSSQLPIASGMGSGAAVSTAVVRALLAHYGADWPAERVSALVFEAEKLYHGTPSGIDNTVIAYERPVYFVRGHPPELLRVGRPLPLLIADSGIPNPTRTVVGAVREAWRAEPARYEALFDAVGAVVGRARRALEEGALPLLGELMDENQRLLVAMGVSVPALERLIAVARAAGAWGAKLSGAGRGGNIVALAAQDRVPAVRQALEKAGAAQVLVTMVGELEAGK